jgi:capsid portal protein
MDKILEEEKQQNIHNEVAGMKRARNAHKILVGKPEGRKHYLKH